MNDRARAVVLLTQAREALAARLTEQVLEHADELLADARGDSYMNEIDGLYEQIGVKLAHVNQMLSALPAAGATTERSAQASAAESHSFDTYSVSGDTDLHLAFDRAHAEQPHALSGPLIVAAPQSPALPAGPMALPPGTPLGAESPPPTGLQALGGFFAAIQAGHILAAGQTLAALLGLESQRSIVCAAHFAERLRLDPGAVRRLLQNCSDLGPPGAVAFLQQAFGLNPAEAETALGALGGAAEA